MRRLIAAIVVLASACCAQDDLEDMLLVIGNAGGPLELNQLAERNWRPGQLKKMETYCKLTLAEVLLEKLLDRSQMPVRKYTWEPGTHDRTIRAGRAAAALEEMLGVKLANITFDTTSDQLDAIQEDAKKKVREYRMRVIQAAAQNAPSVEALRKKYAGKIKTCVALSGEVDERRKLKAGYDSVAALVQLLSEWYPLGKRRSELEEIVGTPTGQLQQFRTYEFPAGTNGFGAAFIVKDGIITGVIFFCGAF